MRRRRRKKKKASIILDEYSHFILSACARVSRLLLVPSTLSSVVVRHRYE
jgi:hypothetical protein